MLKFLAFLFLSSFSFANQVTISLPDSQSIQISYKNEKPHAMTYGDYTRVFEYDAGGRLIKDILPNDLGTITYTYDEDGYLTYLSSPYFTQSWTYDELGRPIQIISNEKITKYKYNKDNQLISENETIYEYASTHHILGINSEPIFTNDAGQIEKIGDIKCGYDDLGRLIQKGVTLFQYDKKSQLVRVKTEDLFVSFTYDDKGMRLSKTISTLEGELIDHENYLNHELWEIASYAQDGSLKSLRVLHPENPLHTVFIEESGKVSFPINNPQGHTLCLIDECGLVKYNILDNSFGQHEEPLLHPWAYTSHRYDTETGLYYFGMRYYDPQLYTWMTPDPLGPVNSENLYQYLLNNPLCYTDLDGQFAVLIPLTGVVLKEILTGAAVAIGGICAGWGAAKLAEKTANYPPLPAHPDDLGDGYIEISHPEAKEAGYREFINPQTGETIRFDEGVSGKKGYKGIDHWHRENPNSEKGNEDRYLDKNGKPTPKGSEASHLKSGE